MGETIEAMLASDEYTDEQLILAVREAMAEDKLNQAGGARACGISVSTFSAWLGETYKGNRKNFDRAVIQWLRSRKDQQKTRSAMPPPISFVETPTSQAIMALLVRAQFEPAMVTITGSPGIGKTMSILEHRRCHPNVLHITASKSTSRAASILDCLCDLLGIYEGSPARRGRQIAASLKGRNALIVIDEAQHLTMDAIDELRNFHDNPDCAVGLAFVGHADVRRRMTGGGRRGQYAQLTSRFAAHMVREKPSPSDINAVLDAEGIADPDARKLLKTVAAEPGALRELKFVLRSARMIAHEMDAEAPDASHIEAAHKQRQVEMGGCQ